MKKSILSCLFILIVSVCNSQEWFTNFDVAKRLALVQDKMLFVLWEDSFKYSIPVIINTEKGEVMATDLAKDVSLDPVIWEYFVPVKLQELQYEEFLKNAKGRGDTYVNKLNDNSIKIMDFNGNILNANNSYEEIDNLTNIILKYALNTSYLKSDLENYDEEKNFTNAMRLALKYVDYSIFADDAIKEDIIALANIYLDESEKMVSEMKGDEESYEQKIELIRIKELVILNEARKANRKLKRIDAEEIDPINEPLFIFLNYTVAKMLNDEAEADIWKSKISSVDLKKAELILKE